MRGGECSLWVLGRLLWGKWGWKERALEQERNGWGWEGECQSMRWGFQGAWRGGGQASQGHIAWSDGHGHVQGLGFVLSAREAVKGHSVLRVTKEGEEGLRGLRELSVRHARAGKAESTGLVCWVKGEETRQGGTQSVVLQQLWG